jgi:hypothetical protein
MYTCYGKGSPGYPPVSMCLASSSDPTSATGWTLHGTVGFGDGSKSGALLIRPSPPHYLYVWPCILPHLEHCALATLERVLDTQSHAIALGPHGHAGRPPPLLCNAIQIRPSRAFRFVAHFVFFLFTEDTKRARFFQGTGALVRFASRHPMISARGPRKETCSSPAHDSATATSKRDHRRCFCRRATTFSFTTAGVVLLGTNRRGCVSSSSFVVERDAGHVNVRTPP